MKSLTIATNGTQLLSMTHLTSAMPMVNAIGMLDGDATKSGNGMIGPANGITSTIIARVKIKKDIDLPYPFLYNASIT